MSPEITKLVEEFESSMQSYDYVCGDPTRYEETRKALIRAIETLEAKHDKN